MQIGVVYPQTDSESPSRTLGSTTCWPKTTCSLWCTPTERHDSPGGIPKSIRSTTPSSCSATSQRSPNESASPPGYSSFPNAGPRWWHARRPTSTLLSGGRLRLGVGVGSNYVEYQALARASAPAALDAEH